MRYKPEHKRQTRDRIVRNAARKLRAEGLSGAGVGSVMKASGLTVGGFYKHFRSKDELLADAIAMGFSEFGEKAHSVAEERAASGLVEGNRPMVPLTRALQSSRHRLPGREFGAGHCSRQTQCQETNCRPSERLMEQWVEFMPGATATERERNFFVIFSAMAGAVSTARLSPSLPKGRKSC